MYVQLMEHMMCVCVCVCARISSGHIKVYLREWFKPVDAQWLRADHGGIGYGSKSKRLHLMNHLSSLNSGYSLCKGFFQEEVWAHFL